MKASRVQEAIEILKTSVEDSSVKRKRAPKLESKKSKKVPEASKKVRKNYGEWLQGRSHRNHLC
jgi:hypothetical protein